MLGKKERGSGAAEGNINVARLQRFLSGVHILTGEKRLQRNLYFASKEPDCGLRAQNPFA